jgi:hypothetical protein
VQNQNAALEDLSRMFVSNPDNPTPGNDLIVASRFDFTIESLSVMDDHIDEMRTRNLSDDEWNSFILRAGAYVGEVIRRLSTPETEWVWLSHEQAADVSDFVASHEMSIGTAAVLWDGAEGIVFPLGKVAKFIANGREDSVHFYAQVIVAGPPNVG